MDERQQLIQSQEQLKQSLNNVFRDLKAYGKAVAKHTGAIYAEKKDDLLSKIEFAKLEREMESDINARTKEYKAAMKELLKKQDRIKREQRVLQIKQEAKQKISSTFGKLGRIKNDVLAKLSLNNIDVKLRNFYEQTEIAGLTIANKGKTLYDNVNKKVDDFTRDQIAKYYEYKAEKADIKAFKEAKRLTEKLEIEKTNTRIKERKSAMNEVLNAQEREMYEVQHLKNVAKKQELIDSLVSSVRTR